MFRHTFASLAFLLCLGAPVASADSLSTLDGWLFGLDSGLPSGKVTSSAGLGLFDNSGYPIPPTSIPLWVDHTAFNAGTISFNSGLVTGNADGLGTLKFTVTGAGLHMFSVMLDHHLAADPADFYKHDYGVVHGTPAPGQTWEIGDPVLDPIFSNANYGPAGLTNAIDFYAAQTPGEDCCDISLALGYAFLLQADQTARISINVGAVAPNFGFFLEQTDGNKSIYMSGDLAIFGSQVPEPSSWFMIVGGGILIGLTRIRKKSA